jgi:hypothetical protein
MYIKMPAPLYVMSPAGECLWVCGAHPDEVSEHLQRATSVGQLAANMVPMGTSGGHDEYIEVALPATRERLCLLMVEMDGLVLMAGSIVEATGTVTHGMVPLYSPTQVAEGMCHLTLADHNECNCSAPCRRSRLGGLFVRGASALSKRGCSDAERSMVAVLTRRKEPVVSLLSLLLAAAKLDERARDPKLFSGKDVLGSSKAVGGSSEKYNDVLSKFTSLNALPTRDVHLLLEGVVGSLCATPITEMPDEAIVQLAPRVWAAHARVVPDEVLSDGGAGVISRLRTLM